MSAIENSGKACREASLFMSKVRTSGKTDFCSGLIVIIIHGKATYPPQRLNVLPALLHFILV